MTRRAVYQLTLTPHQHMALASVIGEYMTSRDPAPIEVSIDATTGAELPIGDLLGLVLAATPHFIEDDPA